MRVQYSTLKQYMDTIASWAKIHTSRDIQIKPDFGNPRDQWKEHPQLETIYKDAIILQGMIKRQDPITKLMIIWLIQSMAGKDCDCFTSVLCEFLIMGIQTGWWRVEWAQPKDWIKHGFYEYDKPSSPFETRVYALCIEDIKFKYANGRIVKDPMTVADVNVARTLIRWRYQKNLNHGQEVEFEALLSNLMFCFCLAGLRTYWRFVQICDKPNTPVAVSEKKSEKQTMHLACQTQYQIKDATGSLESLLSQRRNYQGLLGKDNTP